MSQEVNQSTDVEWEKWGQRDPYFGVITWDRFRAGKLDDQALAEFFTSGQLHVDYVMHTCRGYFDAAFAPRRVLDFGCGVGRMLIPFSSIAAEVVGVDVSPSMRAEAEKNLAQRGIGNVVLVGSDDELSQVKGDFDLVHSVIVLQHIPTQRGRHLFQRLIERVAPGGIGALHLTYAKAYHPDTFGQPPEPQVQAGAGPLSRLLRLSGARAEPKDPAVADADPEMLMNAYNLSEIAYLMQTAGIVRFHSEFTDHGGELGVFVFFRRPVPA